MKGYAHYSTEGRVGESQNPIAEQTERKNNERKRRSWSLRSFDVRELIEQIPKVYLTCATVIARVYQVSDEKFPQSITAVMSVA